MVRILVCCASGMSTSLLVEKMKEAAAERNIEAKIWAVPTKDIKKDSAVADVILLGPQVLYMRSKIVHEITRDIPVEMISMRDYGMMDGDTVLDQALSLINNAS